MDTRTDRMNKLMPKEQQKTDFTITLNLPRQLFFFLGVSPLVPCALHLVTLKSLPASSPTLHLVNSLQQQFRLDQ